MEKALLKVTRFNSTDVITTSCAGGHSAHWVYKSMDDEGNVTIYQYENNGKTSNTNVQALPEGFQNGGIMYLGDGGFKYCDYIKK